MPTYIYTAGNVQYSVDTSVTTSSDSTSYAYPTINFGNITGVTYTTSASVAWRAVDWVWDTDVYQVGHLEQQHRERCAQRAEEVQRVAIIRDKAKRRAEDLLLQFLGEQQREQYRKDRCFEVLSRDGKRTYRIKYGWAGNVLVLNERGVEVETLCIHPGVDVPEEDNLLAQKLLLEADEARFRQIANITRLRVAA